MTDLLKLNSVRKQSNRIAYDHTASAGISRFIIGKMWAEYSENIESMPESIAVIPFIANVLPFIWLTNSVLEVNEVDKDFFECVNEVREGYKEMYPMLSWGGGTEIFSYC